MTSENVGKLTISAVIVWAFLAYVVMLFFVPVPTEMKDVVNTAGGLLGGAFVSVANYWVGSSAGSVAKNKTISDQLPAPAPAQPPAPKLPPEVKP